MDFRYTTKRANEQRPAKMTDKGLSQQQFSTELDHFYSSGNSNIYLYRYGPIYYENQHIDWDTAKLLE